ncbi:hypothetical protein LEP1GSC034_3496 [Leptospira interrogans str. 2003000735]|uniref:Uncharacterized protein n=2 Tax=Leptospira interrogans TaxID=173 RepID=A0A829D5Z9_LEPIR|nr:hypothetical protein LEP1GSC027_3932 [Leptospira interrogans str. 2002000624]EKO23336.1 hypothetical protein LEP1GSC104_0258 [Leptospira interrogans str. UI 12621]EKO86977.1 hypothetical protein LEP1GSC009_4683 [Leptospira interrogans serovar Grippotyphosa str. Andaman]EKP86544.1 hypothetical protein LEP1GSC020_0959 [Leptospira interrogans serovar Grippotyphosa str. 2006006986]EKQ35845.1 hypothetical protein LEP1GSC025_2401 [Leptospira interrogans str. 2002000621]EKR18598.1 hypothetical pro
MSFYIFKINCKVWVCKSSHILFFTEKLVFLDRTHTKL